MKFYIIYDKQSKGIQISNIINKLKHNAILSDEELSNVPTILKDINSNLDQYDKIIILNSNPKNIEIQANKLQNVQATVCKDLDDAREISKLNVNTIIINSDIDNEDFESLLNAIIDIPNLNINTTSKAVFKQPKPIYNNTQQIKEAKANTQITNKTDTEKVKVGNKKSNIVEDIKEKGVSKFLKDAFGIED